MRKIGLALGFATVVASQAFMVVPAALASVSMQPLPADRPAAGDGRGGGPAISIDPASLAATQAPDTVTEQTFAIANTGDGDLEWLISYAAGNGWQPDPGHVPQARVIDELDEAQGIDRAEAEPRDQPGISRLQGAARRGALAGGLLLIPSSTSNAERVLAFDAQTGDLVDENFIPFENMGAATGTPKDIRLNAEGDGFLLVDQINDIVNAYDLDGNDLGIFAPVGGADASIMDNLRSSAYAANGSLIVSSDGGTNADAIVEFDPADGSHLGTFVATGLNGLESPWSIIVRDGDVLVSGGLGSGSVFRFNPDGSAAGTFADNFYFQQQITEAANGNILVAHWSTGSGAHPRGIVELDGTDGSVVEIYPLTSSPRGVAELGNGNLLVSDGVDVLEVSRADGSIVSTKFSGISGQHINFVQIDGSGGGGCDVTVPHWLSVSPGNGSTAAGASTEVTVEFDSTGLDAGDYTAELCVESNDAANPDVRVPVTLTVQLEGEDGAQIEVDPAGLSYTLSSGQVATQALSIDNVGTGNLVWTIETDTISGGGGGHVPELDEVLSIPDFQVASAANGGSAVTFTVPGGVVTTGEVVGFTFEGTVAGITGSSSWASDTCLLIEAPDGSTYGVGGISGASAGCNVNDWEFQGSSSTSDGTYSSQHLDAFTNVADAGDWTFTFSNDWNSTAAAAMDWSGVTVTLHKYVVPEDCEFPNDVDWLAVNPASGGTAPGGTSTVEVTVDAASLPAGSHEALLCVNSNDDVGNELVVVPVDVTVTAPQITVDPGEIVAAADTGGSTDATLTIGNEGDGDLIWTADEAPAGALDPRAHFPARERTLPSVRGFDPDASVLAANAPAELLAKWAQQVQPSDSPVSRAGYFGHSRGTAGVPAYTNTGYTRSDYVTFDALVPGTLTTVADPQVGTIYAATFLDNDFTRQFFIAGTPATGATLVLGAYGYIDTATGAVTQSGVVTTPPGASWTSAAQDPTTGTVYAMAVTGAGNNQLFTVDPDTGATTLVGALSGPPAAAALVVGIAVSPEGLMYGLDIGADVLIAIDKATAEAALIGSLGINANYAQDIDFDQSTGVLYWPSFSATNESQVFTIDPATGTPTVIGPVQDTAELLSFSIAVAGGNCSEPADVDWLSLSPAGGTIVAGAPDQDVTVTLDAGTLTDGLYEASVCVRSNDPSRAVVEVPVSFTVGEGGGGDEADLGLSLFGTPSTVEAGGSVSLGAAVANFGPAAATDVEVVLALPTEFTFVSGRLIQGGGNWTCADASGTVTCELVSGTLAIGEVSAVLQIEVDVAADAAGGPVQTTGEVSGSTTDLNAANDTAAVTTTISGGGEPTEDAIFCDGFEEGGDGSCGGGGGDGGEPGVYDNRDDFLANVTNGSYEEDFTGVPEQMVVTPLTFDEAGYSYSVFSALPYDPGPPSSGGLYNPADSISLNSADDQIVVTFTSGNVSAVGGNFWATDINFNETGTEIVLTLSDGTTETITASTSSSFVGFVTEETITSLTIDAPDVPALAWPTLDNLIVGTR